MPHWMKSGAVHTGTGLGRALRRCMKPAKHQGEYRMRIGTSVVNQLPSHPANPSGLPTVNAAVL